MSQATVFRFDPLAMPAGDSHGGLGVLLASRVRGRRPGSSIRHIDLVVLEPGATIGTHQHAADNEEIYVVVAGQGQMLVDDAWIPVSSGSVIPNPPGGRHGFANTSNAEVRLVVMEVACAPDASPAATDTGVNVAAVAMDAP